MSEIGDVQPKAVATKVAQLHLTVLPAEDFADLTSDLNAHPEQSGKKLSAIAMGDDGAGNLSVFIATGEEVDSPWIELTGTAVTPV